MKYHRVIILISLLWVLPVHAQSFLTLGTGGTLGFYNSGALDHFADTYNQVNGPNLAHLLGRFDGYEGLTFESGFRHLGYRVDAALLLGWQRVKRQNNADFNIGDMRRFKFTADALYLRGEAGRLWGHFFLNGMFTLFLNRRVHLESSYFSLSGGDHVRILDGKYSARTALSGDLGISLGLRRNRIFLIASVSHPIFATDRSDRLHDPDSAKAEEGSSVFPRNFINFFNNAPDPGVPNRLDGWKFTLTFSYAVYFRV